MISLQHISNSYWHETLPLTHVQLDTVTQILSVHRTNETEGGRSFTVSSIKLWNSLINSVKMSDTFNSFNKALRSYFLAQHDHINNFEILIYNTWSILCIIIFILLYLHMSYFLMISLVRYAFYSKFYSVDPWNNVSEM